MNRRWRRHGFECGLEIWYAKIIWIFRVSNYVHEIIWLTTRRAIGNMLNQFSSGAKLFHAEKTMRGSYFAPECNLDTVSTMLVGTKFRLGWKFLETDVTLKRGGRVY